MLKKTAKIWNNENINQLITAFNSGTLPREKWNHQAHLIVAMWYLQNYPENHAIPRIRYAIQHYNRLKGIPTTKESGYHETITLFWIKKVEQYLLSLEQSINLEDAVDGLLEALNDAGLPLKYYSHQRLFSWAARINWIEPDLKKL